jgi:hypothetical protein
VLNVVIHQQTMILRTFQASTATSLQLLQVAPLKTLTLSAAMYGNKDGSAVATAHTYGRFNEQGFIANLIGFY